MVPFYREKVQKKKENDHKIAGVYSRIGKKKECKIK